MSKLFSTWLGFVANHLVALVFLGFVLFAIFARDTLFGCDESDKRVVAEAKVTAPIEEKLTEAEGANESQAEAVADPQLLEDEAFRPLPATENVLRPTEVNVDEILSAARSAFWQRDFAAAEQHYADYLQHKSDDANVMGELANVYQAQGKTEQALDTYYSAAVQFKALGEQEKLEQLIAFLQAVKDPRALTLQE